MSVVLENKEDKKKIVLYRKDVLYKNQDKNKDLDFCSIDV